jgi:hypothetical protein
MITTVGETSWSTWDSRIKSIHGNLDACLRDYEDNSQWVDSYDQIAELYKMMAGLVMFQKRSNGERDYEECECKSIPRTESTSPLVHCYWIHEMSDLTKLGPRVNIPNRFSHLIYGEDTTPHTDIIPWKALRALYIHLDSEWDDSVFEMCQQSSRLDICKGKDTQAGGHFIKSLDITIPKCTKMEILEEIVQLCEYWGIPLEICFHNCV